MRSRRTRFQVIAVITLAVGLVMMVGCASRTTVTTELLFALGWAVASLRVYDY
jgi:hypothetical protein